MYIRVHHSVHTHIHTHVRSHTHTHTYKAICSSLCFSLLQLNIWDTAGSERYLSVGAMYYRNADGVLFVFDVTKPKTFTDVQTKWLALVAGHETYVWHAKALASHLDMSPFHASVKARF